MIGSLLKDELLGNLSGGSITFLHIIYINVYLFIAIY